MTVRIDYGERYLIHVRAIKAKRRMDDAVAALKKAYDEWHQACIECDRIDGVQEPEKMADDYVAQAAADRDDA